MDISQINNLFNDAGIILFFYKAFAIIFSLIYFLYAIIVRKQTSIMNNTVKENSGSIILFISSVQLLLSIILIALSIFLI